MTGEYPIRAPRSALCERATRGAPAPLPRATAAAPREREWTIRKCARPKMAMARETQNAQPCLFRAAPIIFHCAI